MNRSVRMLLGAALLVYAAGAQALFSDDEARKAAADLRVRVDALEQSVRRMESGSIGFADQADALNKELATLRGQIEVLNNRLDQLERRQKDLYVDLDTRVRKFEEAEAGKQNAAQAAAVEQQAYEAALAQFKANNYGAAIQSLQSFLTTYPQSPLAPSAQYWIGNSYYALRDYKASIAAQEKVLASWPDNAKAADAMLNIASSQSEMGNVAASRKTLQNLVAKYPNSPAAEQARQRLKK